MRRDFNKTSVRSIDSYQSKILVALEAKIKMRLEQVGIWRDKCFYHKIGIRSKEVGAQEDLFVK